MSPKDAATLLAELDALWLQRIPTTPCNRCSATFACDARWRLGPEGWEHRCKDAHVYDGYPGRPVKP